MGYKLLTLLLLTTVAFGITFADIDAMVEKVKKPRVGLQPSVISRLKDPFVSEKKLDKIIKSIPKKRVRRRALRLYAIFGDRVKINGRWYKKGSKIGSYTIVAIGNDSVTLKRARKVLRLYLHRKKKRRIKLIAKDSR